MFSTKWNELINDFRLDIGWNMVNLDQSEYDLFDNMEVITMTHAFSYHFRPINSLFHVFFFKKIGFESPTDITRIKCSSYDIKVIS